MRSTGTGKKSHNRSRDDIIASIREKEERGKRMAKKDRGKQLVCRVLFAIGMILIILISVVTVVVLKIYKKGKAEEPVVINNVEVYVGDREISIYSLVLEDEEDENTILPKKNWFAETAGMSKSERLDTYKNNAEKLVYPTNKYSNALPEPLTEDEEGIWTDLYYMIQGGEDIKRGDAESVKDYNILSAEEYWKLSQLCFEAYAILPQSEMCKQYARNAGDAMLMELELEENMNLHQITEYMGRAYGGYISLLCYRDSNYTVADTCYWVSDLFYQCDCHCKKLNEEEKEHCVLMAYVFLLYGNEAAKNEDNVQHRKELDENLRIVEQRLTDYGYEVGTSE